MATTASEDAQFEAWVEQLRDLYEYAKKGRLQELNGGRTREWNGEGLHVWSHGWGKLDAMTPAWLHDLMSDDPIMVSISPERLRREADADAYDEFVDRLTRERAHPGAPEGNHGR